MRIKNKIVKMEENTNWLNILVDMPKPIRSNGIIYKRYPQGKDGKFSEDELAYLMENSIPY